MIDKKLFRILRSLVIGGFFYFVACDTVPSGNDSTPTFEKTFGSSGNDIGYAMLKDGQSFVLAGSLSSSGVSDVVLIKVSAEGDSLWSRQYGTANDDVPQKIIRLADGSYVVVGYSVNPTSQNSDLLLIHVLSNGNLINLKTIPESGPTRAMDVVEHTASGELFISGRQQGLAATRGYISRITKSGSIVWSRTFGSGGLNSFTGISTTTGGNLLAIGYKETSEENRDFWILEVNANGDSLEEYVYGTSGDDFANGARSMNDGTIFLLGNTNVFGDIDGYALRIDQNGDSLWSRSFGALQEDDLQSVISTSDGGFVLCGFTRSLGVGGDLWLNKISQNGALIWSQHHGGSGFESGSDLAEASDGSLLIIGETSSMGFGGSDIYLIRTNRYGEFNQALPE